MLTKLPESLEEGPGIYQGHQAGSYANEYYQLTWPLSSSNVTMSMNITRGM